MRNLIKLLESLDRLPSDDIVRYFTEENCASFAYALWIAYGKPSTARFAVFIDPDGEQWDEKYDEGSYDHVAFLINGIAIDVRGCQTMTEVKEHYPNATRVSAYEIQSFWDYAVGMEDQPLYGDEATVQEALNIIKQYPDLYGI